MTTNKGAEEEGLYSVGMFSRPYTRNRPTPQLLVSSAKISSPFYPSKFPVGVAFTCLYRLSSSSNKYPKIVGFELRAFDKTYECCRQLIIQALETQ